MIPPVLHAFLRRARADLSSHRLSAALMVVVLTVSSGALVLATTLRRDGARPFDQLFARTHGAHVWLVLGPSVDPAMVVDQPEVRGVGGPYPLAFTNLVSGGEQSGLMVRAMTAGPRPSVGQLVLTSGRWLHSGAAGAGEIVLDHSLARHFGLRVGTVVTLQDPGGGVHGLHLVGIATSSDHAPYPASGGHAYVRPETLAALASAGANATEVLVRLADPSAVRAFRIRAADIVPPGQLWGQADWQAIRSDVNNQAHQASVVLGVFGLFALLAGALVTVNAVASRALGQRRDAGLLKAVGFTPGQVALLLVAEYSALAALAALLGAGGAALVAPLFLRPAADALGVGTLAPLPLGTVAELLGGVVVAVAVTTTLPALRAGRTSAIQAMAGDLSSARAAHRSRLAALASFLRLPTVVVVGVKDAFARPLRAGLTVAGLTVTAMTLAMALSGWATIQALDRHPEQVGIRAPLDVVSSEPTPVAQRRLLADPDVAAVYPTIWRPMSVEGRPVQVTVRAIGDSAHPFPLDVVEGRNYAAAAEALVSSPSMLATLGAGLGGTVTLRLSQRLPAITVRIVGRYREGLGNDVLTVGQDTLHALPASALQTDEFSVVPRKGTDSARAAHRLAAIEGQSAQVTMVRATDANLGAARVVILAMSLILAVIGLANLTVTVLFGVRERMRDVGIFRAIGLTPRQVVAAVTVGAVVMAGLAVAVGVPLGLAVARMVGDQQTTAQGFGSGVVRSPSAPAIALLLIGALGAVMVSALPPAWLAARATVAEVLRSE